MKLFSESPGRFISRHSSEFTSGFMALLRMRGSKKVFANQVYNDYIKDPHHVHMKSTHWTSLSGFVQYLGKTGRAEIEMGERGWYISCIQKDPQKKAEEEAQLNRGKMELDEQQRNEKRIQLQIEGALDIVVEPPTDQSLKRKTPEDARIRFALGKKEKKSKDVIQVFKDVQEETKIVDTWLMKGLIVKINDGSMDSGLWIKKKAVVLEVDELGKAEILVLKVNTNLSVVEDQVEKVLPSENSKARIISGAKKGSMGTVKEVDKHLKTALFVFDSNGSSEHVAFDRLCKMAPIK